MNKSGVGRMPRSERRVRTGRLEAAPHERGPSAVQSTEIEPGASETFASDRTQAKFGGAKDPYIGSEKRSNSRDEDSRWTIRSVMISVRNLDRSASFYMDVLNVEEFLRQDQLVGVGSPTGMIVFLRLAYRSESRGSTLGVRSVTFDVGSFDELDRVARRLEEHGVHRDQGILAGNPDVRYVRGYDPDRQALVFVAQKHEPTIDNYYEALSFMYQTDL